VWGAETSPEKGWFFLDIFYLGRTYSENIKEKE
jgi:hypothetical protein